MRVRSMIAALGTASFLAVGLAAPAAAEGVTVADPADPASVSSDIREVTATHAPKRVLVRVYYTDIEASPENSVSLAVFIDTDPSYPGPEFGLGAGLSDGTDYSLLRMRNWRTVGEPLTCRHNLRLDFDGDVSYASFSRRCLDRPDRVRVGVRTSEFDGDLVARDWLNGYRGFTRWLDRG